MALSPDALESRPMVPNPGPNIADHYLGPGETAFPLDYEEPAAFVLPAEEWTIFESRKERLVKSEVMGVGDALVGVPFN